MLARAALFTMLVLCGLGCHATEARTATPFRPLPPRYAWDGFGCTSDRAWSGEQDSFATVDACAEAFVTSCASRPTPRTEVVRGARARIDIEILSDIERMRLFPGQDSGFRRISFVTDAPLDDEQRATLRCWGVIVGSNTGVVYFGAVSKKAIATFVSLPYLKQVDLQRVPVLQ